MDVVREADGAGEPREQGIPPLLAEDDGQLLWGLGIPTYQDGRVESERVAKVYREVIYPIISRLHQENAQLRAVAAESEAELLKHSADLLARVQEAAARLQARERSEAARAASQAAFERSLMQRGDQVSAELKQCQALLGEAKRVLGRMEELEARAERLTGLLQEGSALARRLADSTKEAERVLEAQERARRVLGLALQTEEEARRLAEEASQRLRAAVQLAIRQMDKIDQSSGVLAESVPADEGTSAVEFARELAFEEPLPRGENDAEEASDTVVVAHFRSPAILPGARLQVKRRLKEALGDDRVADAEEGPDLVLRGAKSDMPWLMETVHTLAADLGVELEVVAATSCTSSLPLELPGEACGTERELSDE